MHVFWILAEEPSLLILAALNDGFGACRWIERLSRRLVNFKASVEERVSCQEGQCSRTRMHRFPYHQHKEKE